MIVMVPPSVRIQRIERALRATRSARDLASNPLTPPRGVAYAAHMVELRNAEILHEIDQLDREGALATLIGGDVA